MKRLIPLLLVLSFFTATSQNFKSWKYLDRYYSLQVGTGKNIYFGELKHNYKLQEGLSHVNVGVEARLTSRLAARSELYGFILNGNDNKAADSTYARQRNLSFNSVNAELNLQAVFFFKSYNGDFYRRDPFDPYITGGIAMTYFSPRAKYQGETYKLREFNTEGVNYAPITMAFPIALGVKLRMNEFINFNIEASYRITLTDYLDDVSATFPTSIGDTLRAALSNRKDEVGVVNQQAYDQLSAGGPRGNPRNNDHYFFLSFKVEFFLPPGFFSGGGKGALIKKSDVN
ncbi:MAG: hypothetical protein KI791_12775 [Cyclobacteriaceae bacterium]|nr:hypothetical protein [Cyclobacteriaceae bacterium SS2]